MMKLRVAILEDSKALLKELKENAEATGLVEVIATSTRADEFIDLVHEKSPEALLLDIDLAGDNMTGIDVANMLKLPVLFVSGKTTEFNNKIESIDVHSDFIVDRIGKPYSQDNLKKKLKKFVTAINAAASARHIFLDLLHHGRVKIDISSVVYITSKDEDSNNKTIYFTDRKPETLIDFTLKKRDTYGFDKEYFIEIHKQYCVNKNKILGLLPSNDIEVLVMTSAGKIEKRPLPVSDNYRSSVSKLLV